MQRNGSLSTRAALRAAALVVSMLALAACASTPVYDLQLAAAESAVSNANTDSTQRDAGTELRVATDKLSRAKEAADKSQAVLALQLAQQAELDAQLAVLTARSARALRSAQESEEAARVLREEIERVGTR
jgi:hypothetical protein